MIPQNGQQQVLPLVEPAVIKELGDGLADHGIAHALVRDFTDAWPTRLNCLETAVESLDQADTLDAVLSVKTASMMVGASQLAWLSATMETHIRSANFTAAAASLALIDRCGTATVDELRLIFGDGGPHATPGAPVPDGSRFPVP